MLSARGSRCHGHGGSHDHAEPCRRDPSHSGHPGRYAADTGLIGADHVKPGAVVVDVGTTRVDSGLVGDVLFDEVIGIAAGVTPSLEESAP